MRPYVPAQPLQVTVRGRRWRRFSCSFQSADGHFSFDIYALSHEHADMLLADIKASAIVDGEIIGTQRPGDDDDEA